MVLVNELIQAQPKAVCSPEQQTDAGLEGGRLCYLASQRHPGKFPKVPGRRRKRTQMNRRILKQDRDLSFSLRKKTDCSVQNIREGEGLVQAGGV